MVVFAAKSMVKLRSISLIRRLSWLVLTRVNFLHSYRYGSSCFDSNALVCEILIVWCFQENEVKNHALEALLATEKTLKSELARLQSEPEDEALQQ